eukprot:m.257281 g.257281  ORF g.257281 m.257281 type:complete len:134 (-) comp26586_c0_seq2:1894-2295(-)
MRAYLTKHHDPPAGYPSTWAADLERLVLTEGGCITASYSILHRLYTIRVRSSDMSGNWSIGQPCRGYLCTPTLDELAAVAIAELRTFDVVGLSERFTETLVVISSELGWPQSAFAKIEHPDHRGASCASNSNR